jgi:small subunit ribosomal protein S3
MIEREFVTQKTKEYYIQKYIEQKLDKVGISSIQLKKIPLGEKIIIETSRPSLIVGSKGSNIKELTKVLKREFKMENPQIEINEVKNIFLDAQIVAERIASSLERFGSARFKGIGHKVMENVMNSGALGVEIIISGKIPSARAKNWRFYQGYLKKCGDISIVGVRKAKVNALLKSGIVGIKVAIMPPDVKLPDNIKILDEPVEIVEEVKEEKKTKKKGTKKKTTKKKTVKKKEASETKVSDKPKTEEVKEPVVEKTETPKEEEKKEEKSEETAPVEEKPAEETKEQVEESVPTEDKKEDAPVAQEETTEDKEQ